jgi:hypothetical protein
MLSEFVTTVVSAGCTVTIKPCDHLNPGCGIQFVVEGIGFKVIGIDSFPKKEASVEDAFRDAVEKLWRGEGS